jgi:hypothetical protein
MDDTSPSLVSSKPKAFGREIVRQGACFFFALVNLCLLELTMPSWQRFQWNTETMACHFEIKIGGD